MALTQNDISAYKALQNSDNNDNGGRMSNALSISGIRGNVFEDVSDYDRKNGKQTWRKIFWKNNNSDNITLRDNIAYINQYTPGDDYVMMCAGTHTDTQIELGTPSRFYGAARLKTDIFAGNTTFVIITENSDMIIFQNLDSIIINNGISKETHDNVSISKTNNEVTITLEQSDAIINNYSIADTLISSILPVDDLATLYDNLVNTSVSGIFNNTENEIELFNLGTLYQNWTIKFYSTTQFTLYGDTLGYIASGNISEDFVPMNTFNDSPYFMLYKEVWQGTWNINDEIRFRTLPAAIALWFLRVVPAGSSNTYNNFKHIISGQSATQ